MSCLLLFGAAPPAVQGFDPPLFGILFPHLGGALPLLPSQTRLNQRLYVLLTILISPPLLTLFLFAERQLLSPSSTDITLVIAQLSWRVVFRPLFSDHGTPARPPIPTDILWKFQTQDSIVAVTASFPLLLSSGTLFLKLSFLIPMTFHLLRGRSIITLGGLRGLFPLFYFILYQIFFMIYIYILYFIDFIYVLHIHIFFF